MNKSTASATRDRKGVDLLAAANAMPASLRKVASKIFRLRDANSAHTDLATAYEMLITARDLRTAAENGERWADRSITALTYSSIVLYARATKSRSNHRGQLNLTAKFTNDEKSVHADICKLRDDAIAHFGPGGRTNGPAWHEEKVFMPLDRADDYRVIAMSKRVIFDPDALRRITGQVHRAMLLSERVTRQRDEELVDEMNATFERDPQLVEILKTHVVNADENFGSAAEADLVLTGERFGSLSGVIFV